MRASERTGWCESLGVANTELHAELRGLWRAQEELYAAQMRIRDRLHAAPDQDLDEALRQAERHLARVSVILGGAVAELAKEAG